VPAKGFGIEILSIITLNNALRQIVQEITAVRAFQNIPDLRGRLPGVVADVLVNQLHGVVAQHNDGINGDFAFKVMGCQQRHAVHACFHP